jgi:hypothetical protein
MKEIILCDIDGTLTIKPDDGKIDFNSTEAIPNNNVVLFLNRYHKKYDIIFFTKRKNSFIEPTTQLAKTILGRDNFKIIMRKDDCQLEHNRNIKENMFKENDLKNVWIYIEDDKSIRQQFTKHFDKNYIKLYMNQNLILDV